ncbi:helix-turn-helix domain-containing protein [Rickettsiales bacterium LUAb2]
MSERFTKIPHNLVRGNDPNRPNGNELGLIAFLLSHADNFKASQTFICRELGYDSRTLKKLISSLHNKGHIDCLKRIKDIDILLNNNTCNSTNNIKKTAENKQSKVNKTNDKVLLNYNSTIVKLQEQPLLNYNTRRLKEDQKKKEINKENLKSIKPKKQKQVKTSAEELPLSITAEFYEAGKQINPNIQLDEEYILFRNNRVYKGYTSTNWFNAWLSWLTNGIKKYGKDQIKISLVKGGSHMSSYVEILNLTEEEKQNLITQKQLKLEQFRKEYIAKKSAYEQQELPLFNKRLSLDRKTQSKEFTKVDDEFNKLSNEFSVYAKNVQHEYDSTARFLRLHKEEVITFDEFIRDLSKQNNVTHKEQNQQVSYMGC